jgi:hypothetical protein
MNPVPATAVAVQGNEARAHQAIAAGARPPPPARRHDARLQARPPGTGLTVRP